MSIAKPNTILKYRLKMMEKLGFDENQSQLLALGSLDLDTSEIKEEIKSENELIAQEASSFVPLHQTLDDFTDQDTYNVKDESAIYQKNPVYKNVKPRLGRMTIDKNTGERKIIHLDE